MNLSDLDRIELTNCLNAALADVRSCSGVLAQRAAALERCLKILNMEKPPKKNGGDSSTKTGTR